MFLFRRHTAEGFCFVSLHSTLAASLFQRLYSHTRKYTLSISPSRQRKTGHYFHVMLNKRKKQCLKHAVPLCPVQNQVLSIMTKHNKSFLTCGFFFLSPHKSISGNGSLGMLFSKLFIVPFLSYENGNILKHVILVPNFIFQSELKLFLQKLSPCVCVP